MQSERGKEMEKAGQSGVKCFAGSLARRLEYRSLSCVRLITTLSLNFTSRTTRLGPANNGSRQPATGSSSSTRWLTFVAAAAAAATAAHQQQQQLQQQSDIHTLILACCISQIAGVIVSHLHCTAKMLQKVICLENS